MELYNFEIFNIEFDEMSTLDITKWLKECRNYIQATDFDHRTDYLGAVREFTDEWHRHYENNKKQYGTYRFKKALLSLALPELVVKTIINGKKTEIPTMAFQTLENHNPFKKTMEKEIDENIKKAIKKYYEEISKCLTPNNLKKYKTDLDRIIRENLIESTTFQLKVYQGKRLFKFSTFEELLKEIENLGNYKTETTTTPKLLTPTKCIKTGYQSLFEQNGVTRTIYNNFISSNFCEQEFGKKLFVNIGFMLELPFDMLNTLLHFNGYSIDKSGRIFDMIIDRAFKVGFGRDFAIDLIEYYNLRLYENYGTFIDDKGKEKDNYAKVPNLNSIKD